jgi:hypothetical protein
MNDLMAGVKKPVAPKRAAVPHRAAARAEKKPPIVYYEVETIAGNKKSIDKFE